MSYLKDFLKHVANHNYPHFLKLWEEYCCADEVDGKELVRVLKAAKNASFAEMFGKQVDRILPLWEKMPNVDEAHEVFRLIVDLDSTQSLKMGDKVFEYLKDRYGNEADFADKIRLIGLRNREKFQNAISNYELLSHMKKGKFVFHSAGWGVGVITEYSLLREQITLEFDYVAGTKDLSFAMAFKTLTPIADDHFLARRFGDPDALEKFAKKEPVEVMQILLRDLGPKTAAEIKDELCELVIPADEWTKWWQNARAKLRKNTLIEVPSDLKGVFALRDAAETHEEKIQKVFEGNPNASTLIQMVYSFMKDFPEVLKQESFKNDLRQKVEAVLEYPEVTASEQLQLYFLLEDLGQKAKQASIISAISEIETAKGALELLERIQIIALKKRILTIFQETRANWIELFLELLLPIDQTMLRDYVLAALLGASKEKEVGEKIKELCAHPSDYPDTFMWYFQKVMAHKEVPYADKQGRIRFFEGFLILLSHIEQQPKEKDLARKMHALLSGNRFSMVRELMKEASKEEVQEFLLLATKCHSIGDHDIKILHSLAEVAHPSLARSKKKSKEASVEDEGIIWTTEQGYVKLQHRIQQIATVETVETAKEIEIARAHGDLRENAEFKASLEKRDRLQSELKTLSDQLNQARIITAQDISTDKVGVGSIVTCKSEKNAEVEYTLLGPWDADPDNNILAFQSKLAQVMKGHKIGDTFQFQGETFTITGIRSYL
jgi:transcription elongation factor GreA-like protein/transcription elongation GreA/GreB family factor